MTALDRRPEQERVEWEDIAHLADSVFSVWSFHPEVAWARNCWNRFAKLGLTNYADELQRYEVLLRFFALGLIYYDFCACAWDENTEPDWSGWASTAELNDFRLGQLVGNDFLIESHIEPEELRQEALETLVIGMRGSVSTSLKRAYRSTDEIFVALWLSNTHEAGVDWDDLDTDTLREVLNDVSDGKLAAYGWVDDGMPRFL